MAVKSIARALVGLSISLFLVLAVLLTASAIVRFFGVIEAHPIGAWIANLGVLLTPELGLPLIITPFGGVFDTDVAAVIVIIILCEWILDLGRNRL